MHSAAYAVVRCLSVHMFVSYQYCVETSKHILKLFHHLVAHHSSFAAPNIMAIFRRGPPNGDVE